MSVRLRPYQEACIEGIRDAYRRGAKSPLLVSPTGSGKTVLFCAIAHGAASKGKRVMVLAHRAELLDQISEALGRESVPHYFIAAGDEREKFKHKTPPSTGVASVQTLVRRLGKSIQPSIGPPDIIICDEAHHATANNTYGKIFKAWPGARRLGVTATPCRLGGEALGDVFDTMIRGPTVQELTDGGYLSRARIFAPPTVSTEHLHVRAGEFVQSEVADLMSKPSVTGDAIDHYRRHAHGMPAVCFCHSIEHSKYMAQAFRDAGYVAAHLDGATGRDIRRAMIADFRAGRLTVLCSVDVISEGFDVPGIHCGILLRPTASESLYLQQIGRCLRTADGKSEAILLDHVGSTLRHGLPTDDREWSLTGREKSHRKERDKDDLSVRVCPKCFAAGRSGPPKCHVCGHVFEVKARQVAEVDGELKELTPEEMERRRLRKQQGRAQTLEELLVIERERNYKPGWAAHVWLAKQSKAGVAT